MPGWNFWMPRPAIIPTFAARVSPATGAFAKKSMLADPEQANRAARSAVAAGAEEIAFRNVVIRNASDLGMLLANLQEIPVHFQNADEPLIRLLIDTAKNGDRCRCRPDGIPSRTWNLRRKLLLAAPPALVPFTINGESLKSRERPPFRKLDSRLRLESIFSRKCNPARWT